MAQNSNNNTSLDEAVRHVNIAFENLTLAMEKIDEAKNGDENSREFRVKQNAIRATSIPYRLDIPEDSTVNVYNTLRHKLGIPSVLQENQFLVNETYKSPLNFVDDLVNNDDANGDAVEKLFEKQYEIKWHTKTRDPDQFSFYKFCKSVEDAGGEDVMTYETRRAHVISRLYQTQEELREILELTHEELCPPIYVRCEDPAVWIQCRYESGRWQCRDFNEGISWISNGDLRSHIESNSEVYTHEDIHENMLFLKGKLHWAVFEEEEYEQHRQTDEFLPFKTQIFVGKAKNGIKERWLDGSTSHCKKMKFARDVMCNMLSYEPTDLLRELLVDLRLLLHKACNPDGSKSGLFIMKTGEIELNVAKRRNMNGTTIDSDNTRIFDDQWKPTNMQYGLSK